MKLTTFRFFLILILLITPLVLSLLPFFIQSFLSPPDRVFMGLHRWSEDYYGYLQSINQGLMGHLSNVSKLTLEPHEATFVHSEYVLLGFIGRFFGLNSVLTYHLSRLFLGAIFVFVAFYFFNYLFSRMYVAYDDRRFQYTYPLVAFFLAFFVGGFPSVSFSSSSSFPLPIPHFSSPLLWWTELDVLTRSSILPHYLMGNILFLLVIILFLKANFYNFYARAKKMQNFLLLFSLSICSFLLAFIHPVDFLILGCSLGTFVFFQMFLSYCSRLKAENYRLDFSLRSKNILVTSILSTIRQLADQILLLLLVFISGLIPVLYYRYALTLPFWRFILTHGTTTKYYIPLFDLIMALGPVFSLAMGGIIVFMFYFIKEGRNGIRQTGGDQRGAPKLGSPACPAGRPCGNIFGAVGRQDPSILLGPVFLLLFSWLFAQALFFLKLYEIFNFDRLRTMQAPFYLPLAFFATIFINELTNKKNWRAVKIFCSSLLRARKNIMDNTVTISREYSGTQKISYPSQIFLVIIMFITTLPTTIINLHNQIYSVSNFKTFSLFSYPTIKQYQAWQFLRNQTPDNSAITALYEAKFLIPTVSGNKIAFGANFDNDPSYNENVNKINKFYQGTFSPQDTYNFFLNNHISYVYWGYQEQSLGGDLTKYPFLQKIFANGEVTIFKVK